MPFLSFWILASNGLELGIAIQPVFLVVYIRYQCMKRGQHKDYTYIPSLSFKILSWHNIEFPFQ